MNKIIQLSLASVLIVTTTSCSAAVTTHELNAGMAIMNGSTHILPANHRLINHGTNNGISDMTYDANSSTAIDVLVGGRLVADASDQQQNEPSGTGGTIGTDGENDNNGLTVRHHEANWVESDTDSDSRIYGIACERGFISDSINFAKDTYLQEMYDTSKLSRIYSAYNNDEDDEPPITDGIILLSTTPQGNLGLGEKALSTLPNNKLFPDTASGSSIIPGQTFVIPALQNRDATISANLSNDESDFTDTFSSDNGYAPSSNLQILPEYGHTLTFTGDNSKFLGDITIGRNETTTGGTIVFGASNVPNSDAPGSTTKALGRYQSMVVHNNATVHLAGGDPVILDKNWEFYDSAKLIANERITLTSNSSMIFGKTY